jgi:tetratricopeptide (TPR) repeat protein
VLARFEAERQALALMDHPNIARVFDGGSTAAGRPFFVMELVKGVPVTDYCDERKLPVRQRLDLFVQICSAVQHAHQKGIIHRDLKPSNLLVTEHDGRPVPKVIDFGLAKALSGPHALTERTFFTAFGTVVGTPLHMAPEQVSINALDVDTRTDVYALGIVLYELLTGTTPLEMKRVQEAAWEEITRLIREEEPPKPSTRLSSSDALPSIAACRRLEPRQLGKLVRGDLDWIVMKALEKDRDRRYETASGLARDVTHYLNHEPVEAGPPSVRYRLRKFVRRHRRVLFTVVTIALALLGGSAAAAWQAVVATRAEREASRAATAATEAKDDALKAAAGETAAREKAQAREAETQAVFEFVRKHVFAAARPKGQEGGLGYDVTLRRALESALPFVDESFRGQPLTEGRVRMTLGESFYYLGEMEVAAQLYGRARAIYGEHRGPDDDDTLRCMNSLANCYFRLGRYAEALRLRQETLAVRRAKLGDDHLETLVSMNNLANSYFSVGQAAEAVRLFEQVLAVRRVKLGPDHPLTLTTRNNLGACYAAFGRYADAARLYEETWALLKAKLGEDHPDALESMNNLAASYAALGQNTEALKLHEQALARRKATLGAKHPDTLRSMYEVAVCYAGLGRHADAAKLHEETLQLRRASLGADHPDTLTSMYNLAFCYHNLDRDDEAIQLHEETLALRKAKLGPDHRDTVASMAGVAGHRLRTFVKAKDAAGCRTVAERWESLRRTEPECLYCAACYRAVTAGVIRASDQSPEAARQAGEEADRAMARLQKAVAGGYQNVASLKSDKDLDSLRDRPDFQKLLAELEAGKPAK